MRTNIAIPRKSCIVDAMFMGSRESVDNMQHLSVAATDQWLDAFPWGGDAYCWQWANCMEGGCMVGWWGGVGG